MSDRKEIPTEALYALKARLDARSDTMLPYRPEDLIPLYRLEAERAAFSENGSEELFFTLHYEEHEKRLSDEVESTEVLNAKEKAHLADILRLTSTACAEFLSSPSLQKTEHSWFSALDEKERTELAGRILALDRAFDSVSVVPLAMTLVSPPVTETRQAAWILKAASALSDAVPKAAYARWLEALRKYDAASTRIRSERQETRILYFRILHELTPPLRKALLSEIDFSDSSAPILRSADAARRLKRTVQNYQTTLKQLTETFKITTGGA